VPGQTSVNCGFFHINSGKKNRGRACMDWYRTKGNSRRRICRTSWRRSGAGSVRLTTSCGRLASRSRTAGLMGWVSDVGQVAELTSCAKLLLAAGAVLWRQWAQVAREAAIGSKSLTHGVLMAGSSSAGQGAVKSGNCSGKAWAICALGTQDQGRWCG